MSFELNASYKARIFYEPNGSQVYRFPKGNIFKAMDLLLKLKVNIITSVSSNAPDFQACNAIENISLIRNSNEIVWSLSGQALALLFTYDKTHGVAAASNAAIAGAVANNVAGQHFMHCRFYPDDAPKPHDFGVDTRFADYELRVKWRDITAAGTLFGTIGSSITTTNTNNYLEVELKALGLRPNPIDGSPDGLTNIAPLVMGLREERGEVNSSNTQYEINLPDGQDYRNILLYTTHVANTLQEIGVNTVLNNKIKLYDTQNRIKQDRLAEMVREQTSQKWGLGSAVPAGLYDFALTPYGAISDAIRSSAVTDLRLGLDVTKLANATYVRTIYVTQERQAA